MPDPEAKSLDLPPPLLSIPQTAGVLQVSEKTVRRWIDAGELIAHRFGRQWRICNSDLQMLFHLRREV